LNKDEYNKLIIYQLNRQELMAAVGLSYTMELLPMSRYGR